MFKPYFFILHFHHFESLLYREPVVCLYNKKGSLYIAATDDEDIKAAKAQTPRARA